MSDDLAVKQNSSSLPLGLGVLGAAGGAYVGNNVDNWTKGKFLGVSKPKYTSFDDIIKEKEDAFTKTENLSEEVKKNLEEIGNKRNEFREFVKNNAQNAQYNEALKDVVNERASKANDLKNVYNAALEEVKTKIADGKINIDGLDKTKPEEVANAAKKYIKAHINDDASLKAVKDSRDAVKTATEAIKTKAAEANVSAHRVIEGLDAQKAAAWDAIKDKAAEFKTGNKLWNAVIGGAVLGLALLGIGSLINNSKSKE